jgi:hypothetical protein
MATKGPDTRDASKTTLYLDRQLYAALRIAAIEEGVPVTRLIEQAAREYLERRGKKSKGKR